LLKRRLTDRPTNWSKKQKEAVPDGRIDGLIDRKAKKFKKQKGSLAEEANDRLDQSAFESPDGRCCHCAVLEDTFLEKKIVLINDISRDGSCHTNLYGLHKIAGTLSDKLRP